MNDSLDPASFTQFFCKSMIAIQGGGVYGISLLGQLEAAIALKIPPDAIAGTSAGAILAALFWAGYTPNDILHRLQDASADGTLVNLLAPPSVQSFPSLQSLMDLYAIWFPPDAGDKRDPTPAWLARIGRVLRTGLRFRLILAAYRRIKTSAGLYRGLAMEDWVDRLLRESPLVGPLVADRPAGSDRITFGDVQDACNRRKQFLPLLFLPATRLDDRQLVMFNSYEPTFRQVPIARAVRASAGFPGVLMPLEISNAGSVDHYADGGIILNFPAHAFVSDYRRIVPSAKIPYATVGLRLGSAPETSQPAPPTTGGRLAAALFKLFTGDARTWLETRLAETCPYLMVCTQSLGPEAQAPSNVMAIAELTPDRIGRMFEAARQQATAQLGRFSFATPTESDAPAIAALLRGVVNAVARALGIDRPDEAHAVRGRIALACRGRDSAGRNAVRLVPKYEVNFVGDSDEGMILELAQGFAGAAYLTNRRWISDLRESARDLAEPDSRLVKVLNWTPELQAKVRPDRRLLISQPIPDPAHLSQWSIEARKDSESARLDNPESFGPPFGVLSIDAAAPDEQIDELDELSPAVLRHIVIDVCRSAAVQIGVELSRFFARDLGASNALPETLHA